MTIQRIDPGSLSRVLGVLYALIGVIAGVLFALFALGGFVAGVPGMPASARGMGSLMFGVGAIVILPICYGLIGWVGGWIVAGLYNWVAKRFGGVVLQTQ
jgi:hypothetical protein